MAKPSRTYRMIASFVCIVFLAAVGIVARIPMKLQRSAARPETLARVGKWVGAFLRGVPPKPPSTQPEELQVMFAGFGRSGSHSLQAALRRLGYNTCHGEDIMLGSASRYKELTESIIEQDVDGILRYTEEQGYNATMELHSMFWRRIRERRPDVKYIFVIREFESWWRSIVVLYESYQPLARYPIRTLPLLGRIGDIKVSSAAEELGVTIQDARSFFLDPTSERHQLARRTVYDRYVSDARKFAKQSPNNTFVFELGQGKGFSYPALCQFLGVSDAACPKESFPRVCERGEVRRMGYVSRVVEAVLYLFAMVATVSVIAAVRRLASKREASNDKLATGRTNGIGARARLDAVRFSLSFCLASVGLAAYPSNWAARIVFVNVLWDFFAGHPTENDYQQQGKSKDAIVRVSPWRLSAPGEGEVMAKVLIPLTLLSVIERKYLNSELDNSSMLPELSALALIGDKHTKEWFSCAAVVVGSLLLSWEEACRGAAYLLLALAIRQSICLLPSFHQIFTEGEWTIASYMTSLSIVWVFDWNNVQEEDFSCFIANLVLVGGILASVVVGFLSNFAPGIRFLATSATLWIPLFPYQGKVTQFLVDVEDPPSTAAHIVWASMLPLWPRHYWLTLMLGSTFWFAVCVLVVVNLVWKSKIAVIVRTARHSIVLQRKIFHAIAAVYVPAAIVAPHVLPLASCILMSILFLVEMVRPGIPFLNRVFRHFLDPHKERGICDEGGTPIMFSHIALIFGCALPLCIAVMTGELRNSWLALFGVICVGVGDAMGALVGVCCGRKRKDWGHEGRTVEGSAGMFASMLLTGLFFTGNLGRDVYAVFSVLFVLIYVTIFEAHTTQMDNLVLPMAGATLMLMLEQLRP